MAWSDKALAQFSSWGGLSADQAADAGLFEVESAADIYRDFDPVPAIVIPYYNPDRSLATFERGNEALPFCRIRYLEDTRPRGFTQQKPKRYGQPGRSGTRVYFPRCLDWRQLTADVQEPLLITEGEAKALVAAYAGLPCMALGGVFNFMAGVEDLVPELESIKWFGRDVFITFDSDAASNPNVIAAEARLVDELMRKRGAKVTIIRLPPSDQGKEALDTFIEKYGTQGLVALIEKSQPLGTLDAKVIALNKSLAWIEQDGMVYDLDEKKFIRKDNLITGSRWSSQKHITVGGKQRTEPKEISIAQKWLTHAHAQRFGEILFRPGDAATVMGERGRTALNMWTGWPDTTHDAPHLVKPFLELTDFIFQKLPPEHRDLPLKLIAYKIQNPQSKVPLALTLIGPQGCGKSLWCECVTAAFRPYSVAVKSAHFGSQFQGWMENTLLAVVNEAEPQHVQKYGEVLKGMISDIDQMMDEKYRPARMIKSYTMYMLTANNRAVGSYASDDRRMIVVDCPKPKQDWPVYEYLGVERGQWHVQGGPTALRNYLLRLDLKGWTPPARAPMTAEKYLAFTEGLTTVQALAEEMKTADEHTVVQWLEKAYAWADVNINSNQPQLVAEARAVTQAIASWQIRPWYEAKELMTMFPDFVSKLWGGKYDRTMPPGRISRELREAGVPYLVNKDDPRGFHWKGMIRQYLVVFDLEGWSQPMSQADFERYMAAAPTYATVKQARRRS